MLRNSLVWKMALAAAMPASLAAAQAGIGATSGPPPQAAPAPPAPPAVAPPAHPATEETLRRFFEVCHFVAHTREEVETQFEEQQKSLPPWYPASVWSETVSAVEEIDVVSVAVPVYRKYFSEEGTQNAIRLFLTPQGQATIAKIYGKTIQQIEAGDSGEEARRKALAAERDKEDAEIRTMMKSMTPKDERETQAFVQSAEWKRMNGLSEQLHREFNQAYVARQEQVVHEVSQRHQDDLRKALREYKAAHPGYEP